MSSGESSLRASDGYTMLVVLIALGFVSSLSVMIVEYGLWQAQVHSVESSLVELHQAQRFASDNTKRFLEETRPDSPVMTGTVEREWTLPPDVTVRTRLRSLNGKVSLNRFRTANASEEFSELVRSLLTDMNYPPRVMKELGRWIIEEENRPNLGQGRYAGYDYSPPGRAIHQLDELRLVSGFRSIGLTEEFRSTFTVHGTGNINPLHFTPERWERFESALGSDFPRIPPAALQNQSTLRNYLEQEAVWEEVSGSYNFFTREDDSYQAFHRLEKNGVVKRTREVYVYDGEQETIERKTRYPVDGSANLPE